MSHEVKLWGSRVLAPHIFSLRYNKMSSSAIRARRSNDHLCVQESSVKNKEPEEKENPETQKYLLRQIRRRKRNIWLARQRAVGSVGAVHG